MVLGLFEGELDLQIGSTNFSAGQKITGSVRLKLPNPLQARGLRVSFYGEIMSSSGRQRHVEKIFETVVALAGEKTYQNGESYNFELQLPGSLATPTYQGPLAGLVNYFIPKPRGWFVHATLDVPMKIDLNKRLAVNIISVGAPANVTISNVQDFAKASQTPGVQAKTYSIFDKPPKQ